MITGAAYWGALVLAGVLTYACRALFLGLAGRLASVPPRVQEALRMIPAAALAALSVPALLRPGGADTAIRLVSPELLAGVLAGLAAWRTRNLLATIAVGLVAVVGLELLLGASAR